MAASDSTNTSNTTTSTQGADASASTHLFDEPDDELEEFESIGQTDVSINPDVLQWEDGWDVAGWDDEDVDPEFVSKLKAELERYKKKIADTSNFEEHKS